MRVKRLKFRPIAIVVSSFVLVIFAGAGLLCLPFAVKSGEPDFLVALFTATSATCVTGHTVVDTYTYFTGFGQAIVLLLIQIGGLGFITIISLFMLYIKKDVTLSDRKLALQSAGGLKMTGLKQLLKYIFIGTFSLEFLGAVLLCISFVPVYGWGLGIWQAVFTSISSFCNAGFSLTGANGGYSLAGFASDPLLLIVVMALIAIGGLGFYVWYDVIKNRFRPSRYSLHTKVVLIATGGIIVLAWALFMAFEWNNPGTIGGMNAGDKMLNSLFFAVTPRTAGHYTVDMNYFSDGSYILSNLLMFVGGSPGSTAGGVKTTTFVVLILTMITACRRERQVRVFKRGIEQDDVINAVTVSMLYVIAILLSVFIICGIDGGKDYVSDYGETWVAGINFKSVLFEVISAISATGLTMGITAELSVVSQVILILLMFFGRVGGYTLVLVFSETRRPPAITRLPEHIMIG
ncbi:MAG TPA: Trk family potassium uptake protein [Candidatus Coproplasma stercoravium]|nr:Trk family potassium uptake protein [Candidatus Coproplasma stercoravium]